MGGFKKSTSGHSIRIALLMCLNESFRVHHTFGRIPSRLAFSITSGLLRRRWASPSPLGFSVIADSRKIRSNLLLCLQHPFVLSCSPLDSHQPPLVPFRTHDRGGPREAETSAPTESVLPGHWVKSPPLSSLPGRTSTVKSLRKPFLTKKEFYKSYGSTA